MTCCLVRNKRALLLVMVVGMVVVAFVILNDRPLGPFLVLEIDPYY